MTLPKITLADISASLSVSFLSIAAGAALGEWVGIGAFVGIISIGGAALVSSVFGGIPFKVSGLSATTGALYIGIVETTSLSPDALIWSMLIASVLLFWSGQYKTERIMKYIPNTVISGFINGVAILLMYKQIQKIFNIDSVAFFQNFVAGGFAVTLSTEAYIALGTAIILLSWRKITALPRMGSIGNFISGSLLVMIFGGVLQFFYHFNIPTVSVTLSSLKSIITAPSFTSLTSDPLGIAVQAVVIAFIVLVSTLITARALDPNMSSGIELKNQSLVNAVSGLLGGFPTSIGFIRTTILKRNHATSILSGTLVGVFTLLITFTLSGFLALIPTAIFTGILLIAGYRALDYSIIPALRHGESHYLGIIIFLLATYLTFIGQLALAVIIGSLLWRMCIFIPHLHLPDLPHNKKGSVGISD